MIKKVPEKTYDTKPSTGDRVAPRTLPEKTKSLQPAPNSKLESTNLSGHEKTNKSAKKKRKKKLASQLTMLIRRVHLFSGLFMLPWVLLYGFTALLFNHPTWMTDSKTEIQHFQLSDNEIAALPKAGALAQMAVDSANKQISENDNGGSIELVNPDDAVFTQEAFGTIDNDQKTVTLVMDFNDGSGYLRKREKPPVDKNESSQQSIESGLSVSVESDPNQSFKSSVQQLLDGVDLDGGSLSVRRMPAVEFDVMHDGQLKRMRFTPQRASRGVAATPAKNSQNAEGKSANGASKKPFQGTLAIVGSNPRELTARSFLLRLHMAHGYPIETNVRWFWAIAVDLMFGSMVFWGLSGVVMWWQIKRTRTIGLVLLIASAITAVWLAIGMHWQLVNG